MVIGISNYVAKAGKNQTMKLYILCNQIFVFKRILVTIENRNDGDRKNKRN